MADIRPFRGVHYNGALIKDWAAVICAPYDIISPQQQQELYLRSEYNFVRLEFERELPQDTASDNKYTRSVATLEQWLQQGVLEVDEVPAIYLHDQYFTYRGREYRRRGIIVRVRLEEWDRMIVRPHEGTIAEARGDRLNLLAALRANTSPILAMFEDRGRQVSALLTGQEQNEPLIDSGIVDGERHIVRTVNDPGVVERICGCLAGQPLYIADGHHRYESALAHRRRMQEYSPSASGDEAFNFVMMEMVDFSDPGLLILPPHRLVRGVHKSALSRLVSGLEAFFYIEKLPLAEPGVWEKVDGLLAGAGEMRIILFGLDTENLFVLRLRDPAAVSQMMPYFHSDLYKKLDVSIVDHVLLEKLLALSGDEEKADLNYSYDKQDAVNRVLVQEYQLAFLLNPVRADTIKAIADAGDKMPRKSTYFYPKLPAGLVLNRLV